MSSAPHDAESIFWAALHIQPPEQRARHLDQSCGSDQALRAEVEAMLAAYPKVERFLERPAEQVAGPTSALATTSESVGTMIGPYKLLQKLGEGGMGVVWVAEQERPVKRRVALKVIKAGMDSAQVIARFEAERQALALMDHSNIAKVLDAGTTDGGRPYFVMELVKGVPITKYCDELNLPIRERLALFASICQAVQHAHQKGIIHRDLKPTNILIAMQDGEPVPKVIDFGVAKALTQPLTERTMMTEFGAVIGTLEYMSPEQAELSALDIDTRADIYGLGALLYELLTGTTPLDRRRLRSAAYDEMLRMIREEEPPKPSTRLTTSHDLPSLASHRRTEPRKLGAEVRGELDWIVMKCLEKDRRRRYETANGLARDIERFLHDEPVEACPPSLRYRLGKVLRRNKRMLAGTAVLGVALLVALGAVAGSIGWMARDQAARRTKLAGQLELILDEVKQHEAEQKWPEALASARRAEALLAGGGAADPALEQQVRVVLGDLGLVQRLEAIRMEQAEHSDDRYEWAERAYAAAFRDAGVDLDQMTTEEAAQRFRSRVDVAPALAVILDEWGIWRMLSGKITGARALWAVAGRLDADPWRRQFRELLTQIDAGQTPDANAVGALERLAVSPDLALQPPAALHHLGMALSQGAGNAELGSRVLRVAHRQYPGDFWINGALAWTLSSLGSEHQEEALAFSFATLALRPKVGWSWYRIGSIHQFHHQNLDEANAHYQKALELDPKNAWMHNAVGWALWRQQKPDEAVARFRKAIELDPTIAAPQSGLGGVLREQNKLDEAIVAYRKAVAIYERAPEQGRVKRIETLVSLGSALRTKKQRDEAATFYRKALELDPKNAVSHYGLGIMLLENSVDPRQIDEAINHFTQGIEADPKHVHCHWALGRAMGKLKKFEEAIACFQKCIELSPNHADSHWGLGFVLLDQKKVEEAVPAFRKAVELKPDHSFAQFGLARALAELNQTDEAIMAFRKSLELDPTRVDGHYRLGLLFREQNKPEAATACFRKALELDPNHAAASKQLDSIRGIAGQPADAKP